MKDVGDLYRKAVSRDEALHHGKAALHELEAGEALSEAEEELEEDDKRKGVLF